KKTKGKYGIGGAMARARLAGQGKQIITSKDKDEIYQCEKNLKELLICEEKQCWTKNHIYRPEYKKFVDTNNK
mgnify:CR=1